jgi:hypothetical protein
MYERNACYGVVVGWNGAEWNDTMANKKGIGHKLNENQFIPENAVPECRCRYIIF